MFPWYMRDFRGGPFGLQGSMLDEVAIMMKEQAKKEHAADRLAMLASSAPEDIPDWFEGPTPPPVLKPPENPFANPKGAKEKRAKDIAFTLIAGTYEPDTVNKQVENFEEPIKGRLVRFIADYVAWQKQKASRNAKIAKDRYFAWREFYAREMSRWLDR